MSEMKSEMGSVIQLALATASVAASRNRSGMESEMESVIVLLTQLALATA